MKLFLKSALVIILTVCYINCIQAQTKFNFTDSLGRKQGHWVKLGENKKKFYDGNFVDDIPVGTFTYFHPNGVQMAVTQFLQNGTIAYTKYYSTTKILTGEGKFINQKKDSLWKFYDGAGKIRAEETFKNDIKNGPAKVYYESGKVAEDNNWKDGELNGICIKFFENGNLKCKRNYIMGKVDGKSLYNFPDGKIYADGAYKNDIKFGEWIFYKQDGTIDKKVMFINGKAKNHEDELIINEKEEEEARKKYENSELNTKGDGR